MKNSTIRNDKLLIKVDDEWRAYVPLKARLGLVFKQHQDTGHIGARAVYDLLKTKYYWKTMEDDIYDMLKRCPDCQITDPRWPSEQSQRPLPVVPPFSRWALDYIGPLPESPKGNKYILTGVDHFTKWPFAIPLPDKLPVSAGRAIFHEILMRFGRPDEILTDQGQEFGAKVLEQFMKLQKTRHIRTTPYHPRTNGKVESLNGLIKRMIRANIQGKGKFWEMFMYQALFAARVRTHEATGVSPFYLVYGRRPRLPQDFTPPAMLDRSDPEARAKFIEEHVQSTESARDKAAQQMELRAARNQRAHERKLDKEKYDVGNIVLYRNHHREHGMEPYWQGPFRIHNFIDRNVVQLEDLDGFVRNVYVNLNDLKPARMPPAELHFRQPWFRKPEALQRAGARELEGGE